MAGFIPNNYSNINPLLLGAIFAVLFTKILFGDYDVGYKWTLSDVVFIIINSFEGMLGAWISHTFI
jgi:hypothetical protein